MKKFLTSLLALAVVMSLAGAVLAADVHDPHEPVDNPTEPAVEKVISTDVAVIAATDVSSSLTGVAVSGDAIVTDPTDLATALNNLYLTDGFTSSDIVVEDKVLDKIVKPVTFVPLFANSDDISKDKTLVLEVKVSEDRFPNGPAAFFQAHYSVASVDEALNNLTLVKGNWYGADIVTMVKSGDNNYAITIKSPKYFFTDSKLVLADLRSVPSGSSSSGGCNVGFAPMALLLGLPLFFLKK